MKFLLVVLSVLTLIAPAIVASAADDSKVKAATNQVETGAKKIGDGQVGTGVEQTAKGIGNTIAEGAKYTGDKFKESGKAGASKGAVTEQVQAGKSSAEGGIKTASTEAPDASAAQPKPVTPMPPTEAGPPPADIGAAAAAPNPKSEQEISLQPESQGLDQQMSGAGVTTQQLQSSNEPEFQSAVQSKEEAQAHAAQAPVAYRQEEQSVLAGAQADAAASAGAATAQMHGARGSQLGLVVGDQLATQQADREARAEVAKRVEGIFDGARSKVEARLNKLDQDVNGIFDKGAEQARQAFEDYLDARMKLWKIERYLATPGGPLLWVKDQLLGLPAEVNVFYEEAR